jgi:uncharacterized protein
MPHEIRAVLRVQSRPGGGQGGPARRARWAEYQAAGTLLLIGPFGDRTGALAVFTTRAAAEDFAAGDPFVGHGVVGNCYIREWLEAIATP